MVKLIFVGLTLATFAIVIQAKPANDVEQWQLFKVSQTIRWQLN